MVKVLIQTNRQKNGQKDEETEITSRPSFISFVKNFIRNKIHRGISWIFKIFKNRILMEANF